MPSYSTKRPPRLASYGWTSMISPASSLAAISSQPFSFTALRRDSNTMPSSISVSITLAETASPSFNWRPKATSRRGTRPTPRAPRSIKISCFLTDITVPSIVSPRTIGWISSPARSSSIVILAFVAIYCIFLSLELLIVLRAVHKKQ